MTIDPLPATGFPRILQGQELLTLRGAFSESNECEKIDAISASRRYAPDNWLPVGRPESSSFTDILSGFGSQTNGPLDLCMTTGGDQGVLKRQVQANKSNLIGNTWSAMPSDLSLNPMDSSFKEPMPVPETSYQTRGDVRYGAYRDFSFVSDPNGDNQQTNWLMPPPVSSYLQMAPPQSREITAMKPKEGNCKLFGIPLICNSDQQPKAPMVVDNQYATSELEKEFQFFHPIPVARDRESKGPGSTRSCTKVHKQGSALGRSVDLSKFDKYDDLIAELDNIFEFNGELMVTNKIFLVVYTDDEDDMMLVGDDPWEEFCGMVRKILILTKEEAHCMNPGTVNSKGEETSSVAEGLCVKEHKNLALTSSSNQDDG